MSRLLYRLSYATVDRRTRYQNPASSVNVWQSTVWDATVWDATHSEKVMLSGSFY